MARTNLERNVNPLLITNVKGNVKSVSLVPGYLIKVVAYNADTPDLRFLQIFDEVASDVIVGVTVPKYVLPVPIAVIDDNDFGMQFNKGLSCAMTTGPLNSVGATIGGTITFLYKEF